MLNVVSDGFHVEVEGGEGVVLGREQHSSHFPRRELDGDTGS